jgi:diguanylate cyclase (GGDEF)-like protein/PAS domain S-box-containing protein
MKLPSTEPDPAVGASDAAAVLLVNDDPGALFALRTVLGELDIDIVTAASGEQALLQLLRQDFNLILMDVKMTGLDGFETARLIRARPRSRDTPIIFLTSHRATDLDRTRGFEVGAADYLFMPVPPDSLRAKVRAFVDSAKRPPQDRPHQRPEPARVPQAWPSGGDTSLEDALNAGAASLAPAAAALAHPAAARLVLEHAGDYVALLSGDGAWLYASPSYQRDFGAAIMPGASYFDIIHPDDRARVAMAFVDVPGQGSHTRVQYRISGPTERHLESDANLVRTESGVLAQLVVVSRDITERKEMEAYVVQQSFHDSLTGLPNRLLLVDRLKQVTTHRKHPASPLAVLFLDLDHFKEVNDSIGHAAGDRLLQDVSERISSCVREADTVARVGGDEFVVMLVDLHELADAAVVADKIIAAVSASCQIEGSELHVTPSIGLAVFPSDGVDPDSLLRNADVAMYHAKREGGGRYAFFTPEMQEAASRRLALGNAIGRAIRAEEFLMYYQPKISSADGRICGFESLIRWPQADGSWIPPSQFIPIAEQTGRIEPIGEWAIRQVTEQLHRWRQLGIENVPISVNVSALQFRRDNVARSLADAVQQVGVPASLLEVELTESGVMSNPCQAIATLHEIHELGMSIAIDDFGTGYSSLAYLKRFPIDKLKIDISFVRDMMTDPNGAAIVLAIIGLAHVLNMTVIAEGVETPEQSAFLVANGCEELQGNYFSDAVSNVDAFALLGRGPYTVPGPAPGMFPGGRA